MKEYNLEQSVSFNISIYRMMKPSQKRIASAFTVMYHANRCGNQKESYWGREKIARHAKCSVGSVSRFLNEYKELIFEEVKQRKGKGLDGKVKYSSNRYKFNHHFFTLLWFLKKRGYIKYWHIQGDKLYHQVCEDEHLTLNNIGYDFEVVNRQCAHDSRLKTHTRVLGDSSNPFRGMVPTKPIDVPDFRHHLKKTASEVIKVPGLTEQYKARLDRFGSIFLMQEINNDYDYSMKYGKPPRFPDRWVESRLKEQMKYQYKIIIGSKNER